MEKAKNKKHLYKLDQEDMSWFLATIVQRHQVKMIDERQFKLDNAKAKTAIFLTVKSIMKMNVEIGHLHQHQHNNRSKNKLKTIVKQ